MVKKLLNDWMFWMTWHACSVTPPARRLVSQGLAQHVEMCPPPLTAVSELMLVAVKNNNR